jgi:hypothetical protein
MTRILNIICIVILFQSNGIALVQQRCFKYDSNKLKKTNWFVFYQKQLPKLRLSDFSCAYNKKKIDTRPGNIVPDWDTKFSKCQKVFVINSPNKNIYLDLLSYMVIFNEQNDSCIVNGFDVDQEVNIVNRQKKSVTRIGFFGPDLFVEDAMWFDDQKFILLGFIGNTESELKLFIEFIDIRKNESSMIVSERFSKMYDKFILNRFELKKKK